MPYIPKKKPPKPPKPVQGPRGMTSAQARANRVDDARLNTLQSAAAANRTRSQRRTALNAAERYSTPSYASSRRPGRRPSQTASQTGGMSNRSMYSVSRADIGRRRTLLSLNAQSREAQRAFDFWTGQTISQRDEGMRNQRPTRKPKLPPSR